MKYIQVKAYVNKTWTSCQIYSFVRKQNWFGLLAIDEYLRVREELFIHTIRQHILISIRISAYSLCQQGRNIMKPVAPERNRHCNQIFSKPVVLLLLNGKCTPNFTE